VLHHRNLLQLESEDFDRFSTSAVCHFILHPIALRQEAASLAHAFHEAHDVWRGEISARTFRPATAEISRCSLRYLPAFNLGACHG